MSGWYRAAGLSEYQARRPTVRNPPMSATNGAAPRRWRSRRMEAACRTRPLYFQKMRKVLAMDVYGNLVVIELKRHQTPREVVAQVLDYGSWIRHVNTEEIAATFIDYQRRFFSDDTPVGIDEALRGRFDSVPEELNKSHRLVIVAGELDPPTERIVAYLQEEHGVDLNVEVEPIIWTGSGRSYVRIPALLPVIRSPLPVNPSFH